VPGRELASRPNLMLRALFVEFILPLLVFLLLRSVLKNLFGGAGRTPSPPPQQAPSQPTVVSGGELKKDPVCGTYVSTALAVTRTVNGEVVHFCSKECRDRYRVA
jgi:YHS domain-containing protein